MIPLDPKRPLKLEEPNPYLAGAAFLAWLSKPTKELEKFNLDDFIKYLGPELIIKGRRPYGEIVKLTPKGVDWAAEWAIEYKVQRWHHGTQIPKRY
jgi:hypothetical protein